MHAAESALALKAPIYEAEYAAEKSNPLKLFDSFVPVLEEHLMRKEMTFVEQMRYDKH